MSTLAEQVVEQLKTDMDNVYDAGYQKGISETDSYGVGYNDGQSLFGIPNEVKGTGIVTCDYVNENEHNVEVKLSSDTVTDFSGVEIKCIGKNLWNNDTVNDLNNAIKDKPYGGYYAFPVYVGKGNTFTFSYNNELLPTDLSLYVGVYLMEKSSVTWLYYKGAPTQNTYKKTLISDNDYIYVFVRGANINTFSQYVGSSLQIELKEIDTIYEPYAEKTYTANADGTLSIPSISPIMNIICEGADISAKYYCVPSVEYDRFWDIYQDYGNRKSYRNGFYMNGWNDKNYNPKYPIIMAYTDYGGTATFNLNKGITDTKVDIICPDNVILTSTFYNATNLKTIRKLVVNKEVTYSSTFNQCRALENITIEGEIGSSINFQWSSLLSDASVQNIVECLADLTGSDAQTLTVHADVEARMTEEQKATITSKNWTLVVAS